MNFAVRGMTKCLSLLSMVTISVLSFGHIPSATALEPLNPNDQQQSLSDFMLAVRAYEKGDLKTAARSIEKAYVQNPGDPQIKRMMTLINKARSRQQAMDDAAQWAAKPENEAQILERMVESDPITDPIDREQGNEELTIEKPRMVSRNESVSAEASRPSVGDASADNWFDSMNRYINEHVGIKEDRFEILAAPTRAGFQRFYKEGIGFQPVPGIGFSSRVEIFEEANSLDDYITEAQLIGLNTKDDHRTAITPIFTRAWAARAVVDYDPWPRFTYEFDRREIYHEFERRFNFKNRTLESHVFNLLYTFPEIPHIGRFSIQPWYKRVFQESQESDPNQNNLGTFEDKDEYILALSLRPTIAENMEFFVQYNTAQAVKTHTFGKTNSEDFTAQVRMSFPELKLFVIPNYTYSESEFHPGEDKFFKRDWFVDWGFDINERLRASSKQQLVSAKVTRPLAVAGPRSPNAEVFSTRNKLSYELFKDFDVSVGLNFSKAREINVYDNYGLLAEVELFKPGKIRASLGYEYVDYYNLDDYANLLAFKLFLFQ